MKAALSILIPTVEERKKEFETLFLYLSNIIIKYQLSEEVEIMFLRDNKEMTIGEKRQQLYQMANGLYSWQIDDDDSIDEEAIPLILSAMASYPDCITFRERCIIDGVVSYSNFGLKYQGWANNYDGFDHVRTPFFKTPIRTTICQRVPVPPIRFGEDHQWSMDILQYLRTEVHIDRDLYFYCHTSSPHNERYGIK